MENFAHYCSSGRIICPLSNVCFTSNLLQSVFQEKSELYEKLSEGKVTLQTSDGLDVEFLVDFNAKVKERQESQQSKSVYHDELPTTSTPAEPAPLVEHYMPEEGMSTSCCCSGYSLEEC